ncbi:acyl-CoA thioesterase/bile acid-CoA:amino acid N-acyltransferase family protein [Pseudonocardia sp.]|uniref:acyl-CoA thioesterase/bile acid-CoA:amino acid N-acyltransferase family protein n=1 Tax=Pseudonocardia sp. TaxID=60912 RepID=UPI002612ADCD|nr:acyl-CoA thioesterase/bile acid-CoA:amino acid N-acyltransferase family protein [Pseudonocardia sp.]
MAVVVQPESSRIDEPVSISVNGVRPGSPVVLRVSVVDGSAQTWVSHATYVADAAGAVDVGVQAPVEGTYDGVDPTGPLWAMHPEGAPRPLFFTRRRPAPLRMTAEVIVDGDTVATRSFVRTFCDPGVVGTPVDPGHGVVGTLFTPPTGPAPAAGVLLLGGSDGGQHDHAAALLASHGFAVLSMSYFGAEDTPQHLHRIELHDVCRAVHWLAGQPQVDDQRIAVVGLSRGAELALQVASMCPLVGSVVAGSPSSIRQAGLTGDYTDFTQPAWLLDGEALPFVPGRYGIAQFLGFVLGWLLRRPMRQRAMFERMLDTSEQVGPSEIEVERINGPVLLISGSDDRLWPSVRYAEAVLRRLARHGHPYRSRHVVCPGAGHFVCFPYGLPTLPPSTRLSPVRGLVIDFGGRPADNAAAARTSWAEMLGFLARSRDGVDVDVGVDAGRSISAECDRHRASAGGSGRVPCTW